MTKTTRTPPPLLRDRQTVAYFDTYVPEYSESRSAYLENVVRQLADEDSSLVDVGCGTGNLLKRICQHVPLKRIGAVDVSHKSLDKCRDRIPCDVFQGSICDAAFVDGIPQEYDFALIVSVLHHLIGRTRGESMVFAGQAIENALKLVKQGGYVIVQEPVFKPALMMAAVFYLKKLVTRFTSKRVAVFANRNNIGQPVVSYLTHGQLMKMVRSIDGCDVCDTHLERRDVSWLMRMAGIWRRADSCVVLKKTSRTQPAQRKRAA
jgi:SAM-dependent methyltransferase